MRTDIVTKSEHALRRAIHRWEKGLPITLCLMAELMSYGFDVVALEREHSL